MRRFVIGDIHGCGKALRTLVETIAPEAQDELVFLGDYIDRGPDSRDVVDQILALRDRCRVVTLKGNHEIMLMGVKFAGLDPDIWLSNGGQATVASYGGSLDKVPENHVEFFRSLKPFHETEQEIFVHACYQFDRPMCEQEDMASYWQHLSLPYPPPHFSGKRVYVGHTPQGDGEVLLRGHLVCVDTWCFGGGWLTALDLCDHQTIQVNRHGHRRRAGYQLLLDWLRNRSPLGSAKSNAAK